MQQMIRRTFTLIMLAATLTVTLAAQPEPLPAPAAAGERDAKNPVLLFSPPDGVASPYTNTSLTWGKVDGANKYKVKIKIIETGEKKTFTATPDHCNYADFCTLASRHYSPFLTVEDGWTMQWRVIARLGKQKLKSGWFNLTADTVTAPDTLLPIAGAILYQGQALTWNNPSGVNEYYTLVVTNAATGVEVYRDSIPSFWCNPECSVDPFSDVLYPTSQSFNWTVRAKGYNGTFAQTPTRSFSTTLAAVY